MKISPDDYGYEMLVHRKSKSGRTAVLSAFPQEVAELGIGRPAAVSWKGLAKENNRLVLSLPKSSATKLPVSSWSGARLVERWKGHRSRSYNTSNPSRRFTRSRKNVLIVCRNPRGADPIRSQNTG
jgi:hypothetical protein